MACRSHHVPRYFFFARQIVSLVLSAYDDGCKKQDDHGALAIFFGALTPAFLRGEHDTVGSEKSADKPAVEEQ